MIASQYHRIEKKIEKRNNIFFTILLFLCCGIAFFLQGNIFIHGDVSYLLYVTQLLLSGGQYGKTFFETNPPMIFYLYMPPLLLAKLTTINLVLSFRIYIFLLIFLTIKICYHFLQTLLGKSLTFYNMMGMLIFVLLFLPANQFGQREHFFLIFLLPYLFLAALRLSDKEIQPSLAVLIGLAAGASFCMKPFFLIPCVLLESYFIWMRQHCLGWIRIESMLIVGVLLLYLLTTYLFYPGYFHIILPLVYQFYFPGIATPWFYLFSNFFTLFCLSALVCYFVFQSSIKHIILGRVLVLALLGTILTFMVTRTDWFYHTIPALAMACLVISFFLGEFFSTLTDYSNNLFFQRIIFLLVVQVFFISVPLINTYFLLHETIKKKQNGILTNIMHYMNTAPGKHSVACFSANTTGDCFPLVYYTHSLYGSRYPFFWWIRGFVKLSNDVALAPKLVLKKRYLLNTVAFDLNYFQPRWVLIETKALKVYFGDQFSLIDFFSQNANFLQAWQPYHLLMIQGDYQVYERKR